MIFRFFFLFLGLTFSFSQHKTCGSVEAIEKSLQKFPEKRQILKDLESFTKEFIEQKKLCRQSDTTYIIPTVVHVIHNYGPERISKNQVMSCVQSMNDDFSALNDDIVGVLNEFSGLVSDMGIEFRLAKLDPNGNCTDGITYHQSVLTYEGGENVKDDTYWDNDMYMNIWVVADLASQGTAAYAYYPGSAPDNHEGIICDDDYFGTIGTASNSNWSRHTMPHEVGHYLNLAHPWGSSNSPGNADEDDDGVPDNCLIDDGVDDTPLTFGVENSNCPLTQASCNDTLDNVQNIMDYSNCALMFTNGQKDRAHAALNSSSGGRNLLWQEDNLWNTGVHDNYQPNVCVPVPDFTSNTQSGCNDVTIFFEEMCYNTDSINSFYWDFGNGAIPSQSSEQNPIVTYTNPGSHDVKLVVTNGSGSAEIVKENYITILDSDIAPFLEQFEDVNFPENTNYSNWYIKPTGTEPSWTRTAFASSDGIGSIRISSQYLTADDVIHELISPELDFSKQTTSTEEPLSLYFDLAYAKRLPYTIKDGISIIDDMLYVYVSKNCGESWIKRGQWSTNELSTKGDSIAFNPYVPVSSDWEERSVNIQTAAQETSVIVKFVFTGKGILQEEGAFNVDNGTIITDNIGGNWLYIDNIRIGNGNWDNMNNSLETIDFDVFPQPMSKNNGYLRFDLTENETLNISIYDLYGKCVFDHKNFFLKGNNSYSLANFISQNNSGLYIIKLSSGNFLGTKSVLINK